MSTQTSPLPHPSFVLPAALLLHRVSTIPALPLQSLLLRPLGRSRPCGTLLLLRPRRRQQRQKRYRCQGLLLLRTTRWRRCRRQQQRQEEPRQQGQCWQRACAGRDGGVSPAVASDRVADERYTRRQGGSLIAPTTRRSQAGRPEVWAWTSAFGRSILATSKVSKM